MTSTKQRAPLTIIVILFFSALILAPLQVAQASTISNPPTALQLSFKGEGLPTGKLWSITLDGQTKTSTTSTIVFSNILPGSHAWTINTKIIIDENSAIRYITTTDDSMYLKVFDTTTVTVSYATQYFLTINSEIGNPVGQGWYNAASTAHFMVLSEYSDGASKSVFTTWTGQGAGSYSGNGNIQAIVMNNPITETANWEQQATLYSVTVSFTVILLLLSLLALLVVALRERKKNKKQPEQAASENQAQEKALRYPTFFS